jgi:phosphatidylglycerol:prolipoprotein diacylglycerol transferase
MRQTLFYIPDHLGPLPMFGPAGWAAIAWTLICIGLVAWLVRRQGFSTETKSYLPVMIIVWVALAFLAPVLVEEGYGIPIRGYGVLMLLGVVAGVAMATYRARQMGVDPEIIFSLAFVLFITAIAGARVFYVIQYWDKQFKADTLGETVGNVLNVTQGGLVVYGSLIGGLAGGIWYLRRHKLPILAIGDMVAPSLLVGLAIGRIGCLMNGCCYGGVCEQPWAITFPYFSPPYHEQLEAGERPALGVQLREVKIEEDDQQKNIVIIAGITADGIAAGQGLQIGGEVTHIDGRAIQSLAHANHLLQLPRTHIAIKQHGADAVSIVLPRSKPVHPTQIYSAINATLLAALLWVAYPFRGRDGVIIALLLTLYPITRFLLERIRTDEDFRFGTSLTISQLVSLGVLAIAIGLWFYIFRKPAHTALPAAKPLTFAAKPNA